MLAVYQRCLANYQNRQWDMGAHVLFNMTLRKSIQATLPTPDCWPMPEGSGLKCLSDCLLISQSEGASNQACLNYWLMSADVNSLDFFEYEVADGPPHACQVFSGPAKIPGSVGEPFRVCMDEYEDGGICKLPNIVWSGRSTNKVPVGIDHATVIADVDQKVTAAKNSYAAIKRDVEQAINAMKSWNASNLNVMIFSAEGDMLHQFFDCFMMGASSEAEVWPGPDVAKPMWSRNSDGTRDFQLPCSGEALRDRQHKRDSKSPFTCGSFARRSAIKYFLRNVVQSDPTNNTNIVKDAVLELVKNLEKAWVNTDISSYMCQCPNGTNSPACCVLDPSCDPSSTKCPCEDGSAPSYACCDTQCRESTFLPSKFQVAFAKIKGQNLVNSLFDQAANYLSSTVWKDNRPWLLYDMGGAEAYNWTKSQLQGPVDDGMFDTTKPVQYYDQTELGYPFKTTVWEMCHGLLQQVHFTMPMKNGVPTTMADPYDPDSVSTTLNMTYREDFVRKLVQDAYKQSPLYWHYIARHKPSASAMCRRSNPVRPTTSNTSFFVQGYNALKVGGYEVDCYCGWWYNATACQIPTVVCERLVLLIGSQTIQSVCARGGITTQNSIAQWMPELVRLEGGWRDWPCPSMYISDHWGIMADQTAWIKGSNDVTQTQNLILSNGTSGLRVGSLDWLRSTVINHINPSHRRESVQPLTCDIEPPLTLVDNFVDDLFPAAQGVRHSAAVSSCLRLTIELARLSAYQEAGLVVAAADQSSVVGTWRKRCEMKLKQVSFCHVYGVFDIKQVATTCPFEVNVAFEGQYTLTPSCLVIYNKKVYDPCLCDAKFCSYTTEKFTLYTIPESCAIMHVRDMVIDTSTGVPPWPTVSDTAVPKSLARSSFLVNVLYNAGNVANNLGHWSSAEGESFHYCDLVVDWWPDNWKHPVGYHVTLPCTSAAHRTFDASWAALRTGSTVKMMHVPNSLRNKTLQTNTFGAAGACRTHNYGMPMKVMNSIRFCTQADNRAVDPSVPGSVDSAPNWGLEYCTQSPYEVPWANGPSSVGTYFNYLVDLLPFTSWGDNAGHAPFKSCTSDNQCCSACKCLLSKEGGICAKIQPGTFECSQHQHCTEKLCAGDGKCVQPVLEIHNNASFDIVTRILTDQCRHTATDTWGMSKEDLVPDILENSGLCSYRSWFEQRNLKNCTSSQCFVDGSQPWMFSASDRVPRAAFDAGVLGIRPHVCDRDYEHLEGLMSCNPGAANTLLRNALGQSITYQQGSFTQTYRPNKWLQVVKHPWTNMALGFLGMPKNYSELGYGSMSTLPGSPLLRPCSNFGLCATQPSAGYWYVNGNNELSRMVTVGSGSSAVQRPYTIDDTMACGSMGFKDGAVCRIDPAVVPLFYVYCNDVTRSGVPCGTYNGGVYAGTNTKAALQLVANNLNTLFGLVQQTSTNTWAQYLTAVDKIVSTWDAISNQAWLTRFPNARVDHRYNNVAPRGLYYLMSYSAYEVPFAWWWRCSWLGGIQVSANPSSCDAWDGLQWTKATGGETYQSQSTNSRTITRKQWLAQINGIFLAANIQTARDNIHQEFIKLVGELSVPRIQFACYNEANFIKNFTDPSYDAMVISGTTPSSWRFNNCTSIQTCLEHTAYSVDAAKDLVQDMKDMFLTTEPCVAGCQCTKNLIQQKCAFGKDNDDLLADLSLLTIPQDMAAFPVFAIRPGSTSSMATKYDERIAGCDTIHCCQSNSGCFPGPRLIPDAQCKCFRSVPSEPEIQYAGLSPKPTVPPWLIFSDSSTAPTVTGNDYLVSGSNFVAIDLCKPSGKSTRCTLADPVVRDDCTPKSDNQARSIQETYCANGEFSATDGVDEVCTGTRVGSTNDCTGSNSIGGKYVIAPPQLTMDVTGFTTPSKQCWLLSCPPTGVWKDFNGQKTFEPDGFSGQYSVQVKVTNIELTYQYGLINHYSGYAATGMCFESAVSGCDKRDYPTAKLSTSNVEVYVSYGGSPPIKMISFGSRWCNRDTECIYNTKRTRTLSGEYDLLNSGGIVRHDTQNFKELDTQRIYQMAKDVIKNSEDYFDRVSPSPVCQEKQIDPNVTCKNTEKRAQITNTNTESCEPLQNWFFKYIPWLCVSNTKSEWYINSLCPTRRCGWGCCNDMFSQCISKLQNEWTTWLAWSNYKCYNYQYNGTFDDSCTRTSMQCPYDETTQTTMSIAGLPKAGFCPDCTTSGDACSPTKSSKTYLMMKNILNTNDIIPSMISARSTRTPMNTTHFYYRMRPYNEDIAPPQCNSATCGANFYRVEIYRGMFVCLPCKLVPPKYCTGQHMCNFQPWDWPGAPLRGDHLPVFTQSNNTFTDVYNAVKANMLAMLPKTIGLRPTWHDFLEPYKFSGYNPLDLKQGYNDNMESLDSYCSSNNKLPVFTECQNDDPRRLVKNFASSTYKVQDGSRVPSLHTLSWFASKAQLLGTNVAAWHMAQRQAYFNELFNDTVCKSGNIANLICFKNSLTTPPTTLTVNPVMSGRFEVQEGCDVVEADSTRIIDSTCNAQTCPPNDNAAYDVYNTFEGTSYTNLGAQMRCKMRNGATAAYLSTPKSYPTNLCSKQPTIPSTCELKQGTLGHRTWDGSPVTSVYSRLRWSADPTPSGLLSGKNPILNFQAASALSNITLDPWDIGGHYIRMRLDETLRVTGLPLRSYTGLLDATGLPVVDWVGLWRSQSISEARTMDQYFALRTCQGWDCPLRRRYFWSGMGSSFRPQVPNPFRNKVMYGTSTHPTTKPAPMPNGILAPYKTRNGFCACLYGDTCQPASGSCSAADTIASLSDMQFRTAQTLQVDCSSQVDWPWTGGTLRDESTIPSAVSNCGVLNRLPPFQYRYKNSQTVLDNDKTTLDEGGDCHTGRPASYNAGAQDCTLVEKRDTEIIVNCGGSNVTLTRPKSPSVTVTNRRRCAQCDPLPTYHASDGTQLPESEASYGKLWRWSPARKLAQDLRFRLCGNATTCPQLKADKFQRDSFWFEMMNGGLTGEPTNTVNDLFASVPEDPDDWTSTPWMLCTNTGEGTNCQGAASKRAWLRDRKGTCSAMKELPNANDAVADLTVCDLDENLDNLCRVIQNARYRLFETNCQLSGACRTSSFFYQPATYSVTNDQLARQTVQYFYDFTVAGSCPAMTQELQAILAQNQRTAQECSAQSLEMFQLAISAARQVVHFFVKIVYYMTEICMNMMALIMTADPNPIIKQIMTNFNALLNEFKQFFVTIGDTFYKMIMETGQLGKFIRDLVVAICKFLKILVDSVIKPVTCFIKEFVVKLIEIIRGIASALTFGLADLSPMDKWKNTVETKFDCSFDNPFTCTNLFPENETGPTRLPMPTRCWVGYKPTVGDQKGLGCSASDTCMDDDMSLIACAACAGGTDMNRYGCDALTKLCRCHTFPVGQSQCSSHQECYLPDVECGFVDAYLQPSFGNVPCSRCSQKPICLVSGGVGHCTCMLRATALQTCSAEYHAQRVSPDPTQLCLISLGISASSSSSYSANYRDLASTACANLNGAQTWCLSIWLDQGGNSYMTVGLALLKGRRLLALPEISNVTDWTASYEPCRSLMEAKSLTVLERHVASDCERWRQIGERTILLYNLTNVSDVQFTSYVGMAEADISLQAYIYALQHAEWVQSIIIVAKRYAYMARPLVNMTIRLMDRLETLPSIKENIAVVHELLPWFAVTNVTWNQTMNTNNQTVIINQSGPARRLLGWKENLQAVKQYSVQIANSNVANLAPDLANEWSKGPFTWPPSYNYSGTKHLCLAAEIAFNLSYSTLKSTVKYYTKTGPPRPKFDSTFQGALPSLATWQGDPPKNEPSLVAGFKEYVKSWLGIDFSSIKSYATSPDNGKTPSQLSEDLNDLLRCDFDKVQHCSGHRRSLFWGGVVVAIAFAVISFFFRLLNVPMVDPLLMMAYVPAVMLYVFNFSFMCFPMVPTCFMGEIVDLLRIVLPVSIEWPVQLQHWDGCVDGKTPPSGATYAVPGSAQCFRECTEWPFEYQTWEDNVAWLQCEVGYCDSSFIETYYQPWVSVLPIPQPFYDMLQMNRYVLAIKRKAVYLNMQDHRAAQRVCCFFTIFNVVPVALALVGVSIILLAAASLAVAVFQSIVALALSLVAFIHAY